MYGILLKFGWRRQIQYRAGMALRLVGDMLRLYIKGCIWLGRYTHAECIRLLILELIWILAVTVLEKWLWNRIGTVLEIEGG